MLKKLIVIFGFSTIVASYIIMMLTFMMAFFDPSKTVLVSINTYGEAWIEFIFLTAMIPFSVLFINKAYQKMVIMQD